MDEDTTTIDPALTPLHDSQVQTVLDKLVEVEGPGKYDDKRCRAVLNLWDVFSTVSPESFSNYTNVLTRLVKVVSRTILGGLWAKLRESSHQRLRENVSRVQNNLERVPEVQDEKSHCIAICSLLDTNPWTKDTVKDVLNPEGGVQSLTKIDTLLMEEGWILLEARLETLTGLPDPLAAFAEACVLKAHSQSETGTFTGSYHDLSSEKYYEVLSLFCVVIALKWQNPNNELLYRKLKPYLTPSSHLREVIERLIKTENNPNRLQPSWKGWKNAENLAIQVLEIALQNSNESETDEEYRKDVFQLFLTVNHQMQNRGSEGQSLPILLTIDTIDIPEVEIEKVLPKKLKTFAESALKNEYAYKYGDWIVEYFGLNKFTLAKCVDLYLTRLSPDVTKFLSMHDNDDEKDAYLELSQSLGIAFNSLSQYFTKYPQVTFEIRLTAFSLNPTQSGLEDLRKMTSDPENCVDLKTKLARPHNDGIGLPPALFLDLTNIVIGARVSRLTCFRESLEKFSEMCEKHLKTRGNDIRRQSQLDLVKPTDFSLYEGLEPAFDDGYYETGYLPNEEDLAESLLEEMGKKKKNRIREPRSRLAQQKAVLKRLSLAALNGTDPAVKPKKVYRPRQLKRQTDPKTEEFKPPTTHRNFTTNSNREVKRGEAEGHQRTPDSETEKPKLFKRKYVRKVPFVKRERKGKTQEKIKRIYQNPRRRGIVVRDLIMTKQNGTEDERSDMTRRVTNDHGHGDMTPSVVHHAKPLTITIEAIDSPATGSVPEVRRTGIPRQYVRKRKSADLTVTASAEGVNTGTVEAKVPRRSFQRTYKCNDTSAVCVSLNQRICLNQGKSGIWPSSTSATLVGGHVMFPELPNSFPVDDPVSSLTQMSYHESGSIYPVVRGLRVMTSESLAQIGARYNRKAEEEVLKTGNPIPVNCYNSSSLDWRIYMGEKIDSKIDIMPKPIIKNEKSGSEGARATKLKRSRKNLRENRLEGQGQGTTTEIGATIEVKAEEKETMDGEIGSNSVTGQIPKPEDAEAVSESKDDSIVTRDSTRDAEMTFGMELENLLTSAPAQPDTCAMSCETTQAGAVPHDSPHVGENALQRSPFHEIPSPMSAPRSPINDLDLSQLGEECLPLSDELMESLLELDEGLRDDIISSLLPDGLSTAHQVEAETTVDAQDSRSAVELQNDKSSSHSTLLPEPEGAKSGTRNQNIQSTGHQLCKKSGDIGDTVEIGGSPVAPEQEHGMSKSRLTEAGVDSGEIVVLEPLSLSASGSPDGCDDEVKVIFDSVMKDCPNDADNSGGTKVDENEIFVRESFVRLVDIQAPKVSESGVQSGNENESVVQSENGKIKKKKRKGHAWESRSRKRSRKKMSIGSSTNSTCSSTISSSVASPSPFSNAEDASSKIASTLCSTPSSPSDHSRYNDALIVKDLFVRLTYLKPQDFSGLRKKVKPVHSSRSIRSASSLSVNSPAEENPPSNSSLSINSPAEAILPSDSSLSINSPAEAILPSDSSLFINSPAEAIVQPASSQSANHPAEAIVRPASSHSANHPAEAIVRSASSHSANHPAEAIVRPASSFSLNSCAEAIVRTRTPSSVSVKLPADVIVRTTSSLAVSSPAEVKPKIVKKRKRSRKLKTAKKSRTKPKRVSNFEYLEEEEDFIQGETSSDENSDLSEYVPSGDEGGSSDENGQPNADRLSAQAVSLPVEFIRHLPSSVTLSIVPNVPGIPRPPALTMRPKVTITPKLVPALGKAPRVTTPKPRSAATPRPRSTATPKPRLTSCASRLPRPVAMAPVWPNPPGPARPRLVSRSQPDRQPIPRTRYQIPISRPANLISRTPISRPPNLISRTPISRPSNFYRRQPDPMSWTNPVGYRSTTSRMTVPPLVPQPLFYRNNSEVEMVDLVSDDEDAQAQKRREQEDGACAEPTFILPDQNESDFEEILPYDDDDRTSGFRIIEMVGENMEHKAPINAPAQPTTLQLKNYPDIIFEIIGGGSGGVNEHASSVLNNTEFKHILPDLNAEDSKLHIKKINPDFTDGGSSGPAPAFGKILLELNTGDSNLEVFTVEGSPPSQALLELNSGDSTLQFFSVEGSAQAPQVFKRGSTQAIRDYRTIAISSEVTMDFLSVVKTEVTTNCSPVAISSEVTVESLPARIASEVTTNCSPVAITSEVTTSCIPAAITSEVTTNCSPVAITSEVTTSCSPVAITSEVTMDSKPAEITSDSIANDSCAEAIPSDLIATDSCAEAIPSDSIATNSCAEAIPSDSIATNSCAEAIPSDSIATNSCAEAIPSDSFATNSCTEAIPSDSIATDSCAEAIPSDSIATNSCAEAIPSDSFATHSCAEAIPSDSFASEYCAEAISSRGTTDPCPVVINMCTIKQFSTAQPQIFKEFCSDSKPIPVCPVADGSNNSETVDKNLAVAVSCTMDKILLELDNFDIKVINPIPDVDGSITEIMDNLLQEIVQGNIVEQLRAGNVEIVEDTIVNNFSPRILQASCQSSEAMHSDRSAVVSTVEQLLSDLECYDSMAENINSKTPGPASPESLDQDLNSEDFSVVLDQDLNSQDSSVALDQDLNSEDSSVALDQDLNSQDSSVALDQDLNSEDSSVPLDQDSNSQDLSVAIVDHVSQPMVDQDLSLPMVDQDFSLPMVDQDFSLPMGNQDLSPPMLDQDQDLSLQMLGQDQGLSLPIVDQDLNSEDSCPVAKDPLPGMDHVNPADSSSRDLDSDLNTDDSSPAVLAQDLNLANPSPAVFHQDLNPDDLSPAVLDPDLKPGVSSPAIFYQELNFTDPSPAVLDPADSFPALSDYDLNVAYLSPAVLHQDFNPGDPSSAALDQDLNSGVCSPAALDQDLNSTYPSSAVLDPADPFSAVLDPADPFPAVLDEDLNAADPSPAVLDQDLNPDDPFPAVLDQDLNAADPFPAVLDQDLNAADPSPAVLDQDLNPDDPFPAVLDQDLNAADPFPAVLDQDLNAADHFPAVSDQDLNAADPSPAVLDQDLNPDDPFPAVLDQDLNSGVSSPAILDQDLNSAIPSPAVALYEVMNTEESFPGTYDLTDSCPVTYDPADSCPEPYDPADSCPEPYDPADSCPEPYDPADSCPETLVVADSCPKPLDQKARPAYPSPTAADKALNPEESVPDSSDQSDSFQDPLDQDLNPEYLFPEAMDTNSESAECSPNSVDLDLDAAGSVLAQLLLELSNDSSILGLTPPNLTPENYFTKKSQFNSPMTFDDSAKNDQPPVLVPETFQHYSSTFEPTKPESESEQIPQNSRVRNMRVQLVYPPGREFQDWLRRGPPRVCKVELIEPNSSSSSGIQGQGQGQGVAEKPTSSSVTPSRTQQPKTSGQRSSKRKFNQLEDIFPMDFEEDEFRARLRPRRDDLMPILAPYDSNEDLMSPSNFSDSSPPPLPCYSSNQD